MRKSTLTIAVLLVILLVTATFFAGAFLQFFNARSEGENIVLNWQTGNENNLNHFVVMRSTSNGEFSDIESIQAKGSNSLYTFVDENVYKSTSTIYIYKLKLVDNDNSVSYSAQVSVAPNISSVKRTWGSIKALFR